MAEIEFKKVVYFSSEDECHRADNVLMSDVSTKWLSRSSEKQASLILQSKKEYIIKSVEICNAGSAFVEVQVGRSKDSDPHFQVLISETSFMTRNESVSSSNLNHLRLFSQEKMSKMASTQKWDLFKVICTQPFNNALHYGLTYIKICSSPEPRIVKESPVEQSLETQLGPRFKQLEEKFFKCGASTTSSSVKYKKDPKVVKFDGCVSPDLVLDGFWICPNPACKNHNVERRKYCIFCKTFKDGCPGPSSVNVEKQKASASLSSPEKEQSISTDSEVTLEDDWSSEFCKMSLGIEEKAEKTDENTGLMVDVPKEKTVLRICITSVGKRAQILVLVRGGREGMASSKIGHNTTCL